MIVRAWLCCIALGFAMPGMPASAQRSAIPGAAVGDIAASRLPPEAREAIALIRQGGPFPYAKDGAIFGNREGVLPRAKRGYYREYTVKTPGVRTRGARRIVAGRNGELYYSDDHYNNFRRIRE